MSSFVQSVLWLLTWSVVSEPGPRSPEFEHLHARLAVQAGRPAGDMQNFRAIFDSARASRAGIRPEVASREVDPLAASRLVL